jgi:polar amino acid transport system substrate-binding protein
VLLQCAAPLPALARSENLPRPATLRVAVAAGQPPYVFEEGPSGLEYEYVALVLNRLGVRPQPVLMPYGKVAKLLAQGSVDLALAVQDTHAPGVYYSDEYIQYRDAAIYLAHRGVNIRRLNDLGGHRVAAFVHARSDLGPPFRHAIGLARRYVEFSNQLQQNYQLYTRRVDVVVGDINIFNYLNSQLPAGIDTTPTLVTTYLFKPTRYRVGFRDRALRDRFNAGMRTLRSDPAFKRLLANWQPVFLTPLNEVLLFVPPK